MATVRYLVHDVDAALPFYEALGFSIAERWGPPFAMLARGDLSLLAWSCCHDPAMAR